MKEFVILSGKGGTGKTSITSALASIAKNAVFADCDVDASDLFLILKPEIKDEFTFFGGFKADIIQDKCTKCGLCKELCRFNAINNKNGKIKIDYFSCEGCKLCYRACPENAINMLQRKDSRWYISNTRFGSMIHAKLGIAEDNSGKLVTEIRKNAKKLAQENKNDYILIDGPPGIGCPVISSVTGATNILIVTEPTQSGMHDLERLIKLSSNFKIKPAVVLINMI